MTWQVEPEEAAKTLGLVGPAEARELGELATMLGGGRPSQRASKWEANINMGMLASTAAAEAQIAAAAAGEALAHEANKENMKLARQAAGVEETTPRSKKRADSLLHIDLQRALEEAALRQGSLDFSPQRMMQMEATLPREKPRPKRAAPKKKAPTAAGSAVSGRVTRSQAAKARVMLPSGLAPPSVRD